MNEVNENRSERGLKPGFRRAHDWLLGDSKGLRHYRDPVSAYQARPKMWLVNIVFVVLFLALLFFMSDEVNLTDCFDRPIHWANIAENFRLFFSINWAYFWGSGDYVGGFSGGVFYNCLLTFCLTFISTFIAFLISIPIGILASHRLFGKKAFFAEIFLILIRTFPELLLALFLTRLSGYTVLTAILSISIHSVGMIGKLYADQIDELELTSLESIDACGANKIQRIQTAVMPEVFPNFLSVGLYRLDINIRTGTMLGLIIQQNAGIGFNILLDYQANAYSKLGADTLGIVAMVILVDLASSAFRKKLA